MNGNGKSGYGSGSHAFSSLSRGNATSASAGKGGGGRQDSFDVSAIPTIPNRSGSGSDHTEDEELADPNPDDDERNPGMLSSSRKSKDSVPDMYLPPESNDKYEQDQDEHEFSLTDALESISRASSPFPVDPNHDEHNRDLIEAMEAETTPKKKKYDYSVSLRSEAKVHLSFASGT
jgi:hypothetical protein